MRQTEGELIHILMEFAARCYGPDSINDAWDEYTLWQDVPMDPDSEPELDASFPICCLFTWEPDNDGKSESERYPEGPIALLYLEEHADEANLFQRRLIEEMCSQPCSFFMVLDAEPGRNLLLRDIFMEREISVLERTSSKTLVKGQILYTRVVTLDGVSIMVGCAPVAIPADYVNRLFEFRESLKKKLDVIDWGKHGITGDERESLMASILSEVLQDHDLELRELYYRSRQRVLDNPLPQVRNTDGEEMQPVELYYELDCSPRNAFDALQSLAIGESEEDLLMDASFDVRGELAAVRFPWLTKGNRAHDHWDNTIMGMLDIKREKLVVEVNSRERAEAIQRKVTRRLGRRAVLKNTLFVSLEAMLADTAESRKHGPDAMLLRTGAVPRPSSPQDEDLMALPEVQQMITDMTSAHWATWPDIPLTALEGKSPREAAATPHGRERLEALLLSLEGDLSRSFGHPPDPFAPDFAALRRELGLE